MGDDGTFNSAEQDESGQSSKTGFSLAGKRAPGVVASKQVKLMDSYGVFDFGKTLIFIEQYKGSKQWEIKKVGKGKTPPFRANFAWVFDCKS